MKATQERKFQVVLERTILFAPRTVHRGRLVSGTGKMEEMQ